jgi:hypothetical protein
MQNFLYLPEFAAFMERVLGASTTQLELADHPISE